MTPSQAYAQWKQWGADPGDSNTRSIQKFSQQFGLDPEDEDELFKAYPDQPQFRGPKKSGFVSQTFGAGFDIAQKGFGESLRGPGAEIVEDLGWEGGARALEDIGGDIVRQQEIDLQEYEDPQTREELIEEGGFLGAVYEHLLPEETYSPEQLGRSFISSMGPAAAALGAAGVAALAAPYVVPAALGWTGAAVFTGATAMAVGNATASFQVGGEEFENATRDPFIREQLGIDPEAKFDNLEPSQQRALTDSAQRVAKDTMVERLYTSGALESLAFIPYGAPALRYLADIALGSTSEEWDKRIGMEKTIVELERLGVSRGEIPELRERIKGLRPGTFETMLNAAIMEAVIGGPVTIIETVATKDDRVSQYASEKARKQKLLEERAQKRITDPEYMDPAQKSWEKNTAELSKQREQNRKDERIRVFKNNAEADKLNQGEGSGLQGTALDEANQRNRLNAELNITASQPAEGADILNVDTEDISSASFEETEKTLQGLFDEGVTPDANPFDLKDKNDVSLGGHEHQSVLDTVNETIEKIDYIPATFNTETGFYEFIDASGNFVQLDSEKVGVLEGFVYDKDPINPESGNPRVYITQHMMNPKTGAPIRNTKEAINRAIAVSFHEGITHTSLRQILSAGEPKTVTETKKGDDGVERTTTKIDPSNEWTGDEYNKFIWGVRKRELKKINRWLKYEGSGYNNASEFRQTEEWIARNFGETAGGRELGYFDNIGIALREAAPWLKNSFNQYQVAKIVQSAVDQRIKIEGDLKTAEGNILSGVELVAAIVRAAGQADLETDVVGEEGVMVRKPYLKVPQDAGVAVEEEMTKAESERIEEQKISDQEKKDRFKAAEAIGKKQQKQIKADEVKAGKKKDKERKRILKEETKAKEETERKIGTATETINTNLNNWEQYSIDQDISLDEKGQNLTKAERRGRTLGQSIIASRLYDKSPEIINQVINNIKGITKVHKKSALKQIGRKNPDLLTSELANILVPGSVGTAKGVRTKADKREAQRIIDFITDKKKKLKKGKTLPRKDLRALQSAKLFLKTDPKKGKVPDYTVPEDWISKSAVYEWSPDMPAWFGTTAADKVKWEALKPDTWQKEEKVSVSKRKQEGKITGEDIRAEDLRYKEPLIVLKEKWKKAGALEKTKLWRRYLDTITEETLPLKDKEGKPIKMGPWERLYALYVKNDELFGKPVFVPDLELQTDRRTEAMFYDKGKDLQKRTPEDVIEIELAEKNIKRLEQEIANALDIPKGAPTGPNSPQGRFIKRTKEKIALERKKLPETTAPESEYRAMKEAVKTLDENEQNILKSVYGIHEDHGLAGEINTAELYGISQQRVNQIKNSALRKLELTEGVRVRAKKEGFDVKEGKATERGPKRKSISTKRAKEHLQKFLPKGELAYEKTIAKTKKAGEIRKQRFELGRTLYERHGIIAKPYRAFEVKAWTAGMPGAWEADYKWAKEKGFPPEPAPSALKEGITAVKQDAIVPLKILKFNKEKLQALEKKVEKQLLAEEAFEKKSTFLDEPTAEELIAAHEAISASKGFQISDETKQKAYDTNRRLVAGEITKEQQTKEMNKLLGAPRPWEALPKIPSLNKIKKALGKKWDQGGKFIFGFGETLPEQTVQTRLDISAYRNHDTWVPTIHDTNKKVLAYGPTSHLTGVTFHNKNLEAYVKDSLTIATGATEKHPFAMYQGKWKQHDPEELHKTARGLLKSNEWTQVGMNPLRHSFFYDRSTGKNNGRPVISADEVIQIGGVLLARGVKYGNVNDFKTTTFKGKKARPGKEEVQGSEGMPVTFSKAADPVTWESDNLEPGKINGIGTFTGEIVDAITKSGATDRALIKSLIGKQFTRIPTDRFRTGTYKPLSDDPNHPFNKNPFFMRGGVGYTLIPENRAANAMWASDATQVNGKLVDQIKKGIRHGLIYFMAPDSHFSNKAVWKIYETETDWMLLQGTIDRDRLNARIEEIKGKVGVKKWKSIREGLLKAKGKDNWEKLKNTIPGTAFEDRKPLLPWLGGNVIAEGNKAEAKARIKKGFFSGVWDKNTLEITEMYKIPKKGNEPYGASLAQIYPRITQSPLAANFSVIGISKFHETFENKKTGKTEDIRNDITAEELGVTPHEAYEYILPGEEIAYIGEINAGVDFDQAFDKYLPIRKNNAINALNDLTGDLNFTDTMTERLFGYTDRTGDYVSVRQLDGWDSIENILHEKYKKQGKSENKRDILIDQVVSHVNALRANKVSEIRKGFEMSSIPIPFVDPAVLAQFTTDKGAHELYITASRNAAENSRSRAATNATGRWGRWTNFVNRHIRQIRPLSKIKGEKLYLSVRQIVQGQLAKWELFGKSVYDALAKSKDPQSVYKYLTTPGASPSIIKNLGERIAAKKAKDAIESIGNALVKRKLLKQTTIDEFKAKYGDYLPRVYLMHLLDDNTQTKIASGSLKPSDMKYLLQRKDLPKALRELVFGELSDQPGAAAYLASRATMIPGKDIAIMDWMAKLKDLSIKNNLDWVLPKQFVTFNTMEELNDIVEGDSAGSVIATQLGLDGDLSNMSEEVTPMWLHTEGRRLEDMAGQFQQKRDSKKRQIILELSRRMKEKAKKAEPVLTKETAKMFRKLPDSKRYGQLRGMYVQKQIAFDIMGGAKIATGEESNMERIFGDTGMMGKYNSYWKWAKVAANPPSWARNFMSNNILLTLAGVPMWSIPGLNIAAIRDFKNKGKYYQVALEQGVMSGNMSQAELGKLESDFIDVQRRMQKTQSPKMWMGGMLSKFMDKTSGIYGGLETISKIAAIKYGMEKKGMNESQAATFANKWLFDYGLVTPSVKYASTAVVGAPFIRFQSHAIPLMLEVMLTKPWRLAPYYAIGYGMAELFKANHDLDEEQYKAAKKALAKWLQEKAVNGILPPAIIPMLSLDDQGRMQIYDISWVAPWGMLGEMASEIQNAQFVDAAKTLGLMGGPLPDMLAALKTGIDPFTRRPITDELKSNTEQIFDYLVYITNLTTPSMLHTEYGAVSRAINAITGELDPKTGEPKFTGMQAALRLFGINIYPTDLVEQRKKNIRRMNWEISTVRAEWTRRLRGLRKSKADQEDIKEAREEYMEKRREMIQTRRDYVRQSRVPQSLRAG